MDIAFSSGYNRNQTEMRFQAELTRRDTNLLQVLMRTLDVQSNAELMTHLLAIGSWAVAERRQGRRLASVTPDGPVRELVSPLLERVSPAQELPYVEIEWTAREMYREFGLAPIPGSDAGASTRKMFLDLRQAWSARG